jgi:type IV secretory pathway VirB4 component
MVKNMMTLEAQKGNKIIIIDPQNEFLNFVDAVGGRSISLGLLDGSNIINPMEII